MTPLEKITKAATGQKHLYSMDLGRVVLIDWRSNLSGHEPKGWNL